MSHRIFCIREEKWAARRGSLPPALRRHLPRRGRQGALAPSARGLSPAGDWGREPIERCRFPLHRPVNPLYADLAGKDAGVAGLVADDETALVVHVNGGSGAAVVGDAAA